MALQLSRVRILHKRGMTGKALLNDKPVTMLEFFGYDDIRVNGEDRIKAESLIFGNSNFFEIIFGDLNTDWLLYNANTKEEILPFLTVADFQKSKCMLAKNKREYFEQFPDIFFTTEEILSGFAGSTPFELNAIKDGYNKMVELCMKMEAEWLRARKSKGVWFMQRYWGYSKKEAKAIMARDTDEEQLKIIEGTFSYKLMLLDIERRRINKAIMKPFIKLHKKICSYF